jgi:hypothetical protein
MTDTNGGDDADTSTIGVEVLLFVLGATVLAYVGGAFSATFRTFPYPQLLERPFRALEARDRQRSIQDRSLAESWLWHRKQRGGETGLVHHVPEKTHDGYTLYTSGHRPVAKLLSMEGDVVHEWALPFDEAWSDPTHVRDPSEASSIYWRRVHVFPNGDLLASYTALGDTPYGYGLVKVDRESQVLWRYAGHTHHDFDVRPDGSIYVLDQTFRDTRDAPVSGVPQLPELVLDDQVVLLSSEGRPRTRISMLDALADSPYRWLLRAYPTYLEGEKNEETWDPLHTNTIDVVGPDFASRHDFADPGDLVVSFRTLDVVALLDPQKEEIVWATRGVWLQQHDPRPLPGGEMLVFDNNGYGGPGGASRLLQFDPSDGAVSWSYTGTRDHPFSSRAYGSLQPLENGNVLVTSSLEGRIFEVTRGGEIVWEFLNPMRKRDDGGTFVATIYSARRIPYDRLAFLSEATPR